MVRRSNSASKGDIWAPMASNLEYKRWLTDMVEMVYSVCEIKVFIIGYSANLLPYLPFYVDCERSDGSGKEYPDQTHCPC
jgi:hypothetical protein